MFVDDTQKAVSLLAIAQRPVHKGLHESLDSG